MRLIAAALFSAFYPAALLALAAALSFAICLHVIARRKRLIILLALTSPAFAGTVESPTPKCSTHTRSLSNPFASNQCAQDYDRWYDANRVKIERPIVKRPSFWLGELILAADWSAEVASTDYVERNVHGPGWHDSAPGYGRGYNLAIGLVGFGATSALNVVSHKLSRRDSSKAWRFIGASAVPAVVSAIIVPDVYSKYSKGHNAN